MREEGVLRVQIPISGGADLPEINWNAQREVLIHTHLQLLPETLHPEGRSILDQMLNSPDRGWRGHLLNQLNLSAQKHDMLLAAFVTIERVMHQLPEQGAQSDRG